MSPLLRGHTNCLIRPAGDAAERLRASTTATAAVLDGDSAGVRIAAVLFDHITAAQFRTALRFTRFYPTVDARFIIVTHDIHLHGVIVFDSRLH